MKAVNYLMLPYFLFDDKKLNANEIIILAEIMSLCRLKGYCYASNGYFSRRFGVCDRTITRSISNLCERGYITSEVKDNLSRTIFITDDRLKDLLRSDFFIPGVDKMSGGTDKLSGGSDKMSRGTDNLSTYNNSYNNNKNNSYNYREHYFSNFSEIGKRSYDLDELMKIR